MYACVYNKNFESICLVYLKQREMLCYVQFRSAYVRIILYVVRACAIKLVHEIQNGVCHLTRKLLIKSTSIQKQQTITWCQKYLE